MTLFQEDISCLCIKCVFTVRYNEFPLGSSTKSGSHVYFLLIVAMVLLLWCQIVLLWHQVTIVTSEQHLWQNKSITQKTCNRKYTWLPFMLVPPSEYSIWGTENWRNNHSKSYTLFSPPFSDISSIHNIYLKYPLFPRNWEYRFVSKYLQKSDLTNTYISCGCWLAERQFPTTCHNNSVLCHLAITVSMAEVKYLDI